MASTAIAVMQPVWDCRWSRPGHRLTGVSDALQPENRWVCVREGSRRNVTAEECETCPHWELADLAAPRVESPVVAAVASVPVTSHEVVTAMARASLVLTALGFIATGVVVLTSPMAIAFTVGLWVCAAVMVGFAVVGLPDR